MGGSRTQGLETLHLCRRSGTNFRASGADRPISGRSRPERVTQSDDTASDRDLGCRSASASRRSLSPMRLPPDTNGCLLAGPLNGLSWAAAVSGIHFSERPLSCLRFSKCDIQKPAIFGVTVRIADYPELRIENWRQNGKVGSSPRARLSSGPLWSGGKCHGLIRIWSRHTRASDGAIRQLMALICNQLAPLRLVRLNYQPCAAPGQCYFQRDPWCAQTGQRVRRARPTL